MTINSIALVVQGLFEKSDSIGYDVVFEYKMLRENFGEKYVKIFAERFDQKLHLGIPVEPISNLSALLDRNPETTVIYHYCDGWPEFDEFILESARKVIVRWHNNTPPWFYGATHRRSMERTVNGFRTILKFIANPAIRFWVNSNFTLNQLQVLGADPDRAAVVYPGSRFLEPQHGKSNAAAIRRSGFPDAAKDQPVRLLFVSRVVAHKGHRHVVKFAGALQRALDRDVSVSFLGRHDPATTMKSDLFALGESEGVKVLLKGEVSEDELINAYRQADLFVCFSEHEGFGMPIFEAMRVGLPVMCLGRTALRELMQAHPFMLDDLDFAQAIAATRLLADDDTRGEILEIQAALLETYTSEVIARQLEAALAGNHGPWANQLTDAAGIEARSGKVRARIAANPVGTSSHPTQPIEISDNFVTVYDVQSYENLLERARDVPTFAPHQAPAEEVTLSHRSFVTSHGSVLDEGIVFSAAVVHQIPPHVIYGPFEKFTRGYFAADFELEIEESGDDRVELELDVLIEGGQPIAKRKVTVKAIRGGPPPRLVFPVIAEGAVVEFRTRVSRRGNCNILFKGVTIRKMPQTVPGLGKNAVSLLRLPSLASQGAFRRSLGRIPPLAKTHFGRGDQMRDLGRWNDAADAYRAGLDLYAAAFRYWVQLGNCLKEVERFAESEKAYQQALAMQPNDRDAHLQIARLYRLWNRPEEFNLHLLEVIRFDRITAEALFEMGEGANAVFASRLLAN